MLQSIKRHIPQPLKKAIRSRLSRPKPILHYVELHLTDHCNLDCKGCGHYCSIAPPHYADIRQHERDLRRLKQLFRNIRQIRLMGGEPLLHPDPASFITATRAIFPKTDLRFVTNGLLLPKAHQDFWDACRNTNTVIDLSVYPPLAHRVDELRILCERHHVELNAKESDTFLARCNFKGDSDRQKAFDHCRREYFCPFLENGRIYTCAMTALVHYFNDRFGHKIPADKGINIHSRFVSGKQILRHLNQPVITCKWCAYDLLPFPWAHGKLKAEEWAADAQ